MVLAIVRLIGGMDTTDHVTDLTTAIRSTSKRIQCGAIKRPSGSTTNRCSSQPMTLYALGACPERTL